MKANFSVLKKITGIFKKKRLIAFICILAVGGGAYYVFKDNNTVEVMERMPSVATLQKGDLSKRVTATGTARASEENSIFIELSQEVEEVFVEVGDKVSAGDLLVTYNIEDTKKELETKIRQAEINYENSQLALEDIIKPASDTELIDLKNQIISAEKIFLTHRQK